VVNCLMVDLCVGTVGLIRSLFTAALLGLGLSIGASVSVVLSMDPRPEVCPNSPTQVVTLCFFPFLVTGNR
jgi:hypothetical protein